jgi:hypothetical protein
VTAWAATDWAAAQSGITINGRMEQRLRPWDPGVEVNPLTIVLQPDASDTLGKLAFGKLGVSTYLNAAIDANDTTITVLDTSQYGAAGTGHIGTECFAYTGKTATTFTGCVRGKYAPFGAGTGAAYRFGRDHRIPAVGDGVTVKPKVTSKQREWAGRMVGIWAHRNAGGTLDLLAQAECVWAGRIKEVRDGDDGLTYIDCDDVRTLLRDCMLLRDQWTAELPYGIYLPQGAKLTAWDTVSATTKRANNLVVGATDSGTNQIAAGFYTLDTLADKINDWLTAEKTAARLGLYWELSPRVTQGADLRARFRWSGGAASGTLNVAELGGPDYVLDFLGYTLNGYGNGTTSGTIHAAWSDSTTVSLVSPEEPYGRYPHDQTTGAWTLTNIRGSWFDNNDASGHVKFPSAMAVGAATNNVGAVQFNEGPIAILQQSTSTDYVFLAHSPFLDQLSGKPFNDAGVALKTRYSQTGPYRLRQVAVIAGPFRSVTTKILLSTGASGYNHATSDVYPAQLSAAVPYGAMGGWATSIDSLDESTGALVLCIEKPTRLMDVLGIEFVARMAQVVWKSSSLRCASWGTPTAAQSTHSFTEANKAAPADSHDQNRTPTMAGDEYLVNQIKLSYNRVLGGGYNSSLTILDPASQDANGVRGKTIEMRNTFEGVHSSIDNVYDLADTLSAGMALLSRPLRTMRRTIAMPQFLACAPGDFCTVTDSFARDPATGARGLSNQPALIVGQWYDFGGFDAGNPGKPRPMMGEVDLVILPIDTIAPYCPCAEVDHAAAGGGYNAGTKVLTLEAHAHSLTSETADAARFLVPDKVRVTEVDPDDPAAPQTWLDTVAAQSGNTITLTTGLALFDATKRYRVISQSYTSATTTQQADVYQADGTTNRIQSTLDAYAYGHSPNQGEGWDADGSEDGTALPALYADNQQGDGVPLDTGCERDIARILNNLVNYRTAVMTAAMARSVKATGGRTAAVKCIVDVIPWCGHPGDMGSGNRFLNLSPWLRSTDGTSVTLTATLCRHPPVGSSMTTTDATQPNYALVSPGESVSWTTSSTTYAARTENGVSVITCDPITGIGYLVVEANSTKCEYRGFAEMYEGEYQESA